MNERETLLQRVRGYVDAQSQQANFVPGQDPVPVSGKVIDADDIACIVDACLDGWFTSGRFTEDFQRALASRIGVRSATFVNSGSSANLAALSALTSESLGARALRPGDEVVTAAMGFPTTVNPSLQQGLVPVFVDIDPRTFNATASAVAAAIGPRTKAVMMAHTLGNPFEAAAIRALCDEHGLWLVEDACDALGATQGGRATGSWGDLATFSFYPAHHITAGEGGAVVTDSPRLRRLVESFRDWGRDCYCETGCDNTCKKRFEWQLGDLPAGYDHKYIYSHIGYNLKATDPQAALVLSQLAKLDGFIALRRRNFEHLHDRLAGVAGLQVAEATVDSEPSWFGFPILLSQGVSRNRLIAHLEERKIATRLMFGGNLTKQPAYRDVTYRVAGGLEHTDAAMERAFWVGVWPGLTIEMLDFIADSIIEFLETEV